MDPAHAIDHKRLDNRPRRHTHEEARVARMDAIKLRALKNNIIIQPTQKDEELYPLPKFYNNLMG